MENYNWDKPETDDEALERFVRSDEVKQSNLLWDPEDKRFAYSNIAYEILGTVIATVSGITFEDLYMKKYLSHRYERLFNADI